MGDSTIRRGLVKKINDSFHARAIGDTKNSVGTLKPAADFLDICHSLGHLDKLVKTTLPDYRKELTMPPLQRKIMTAAFRHSLTNKPDPIPLRISIEDGPAEAVKVTTTAKLITVELTRTK